jgi:DNA invertase Pin-like site-specific DNA recombinase
MKTTAVYTRVSTSDQKTDSQLDELAAYCQQRGWTTIQNFSDQISGAAAGRPGLDALIGAVRAGKVERVVVYKLDRLGRSLTHFALIIEELQKNGTALVVTSQGIDTSGNNPVGRLQLGILIAVAEFERGIIQERVNAGLAAAKKRGVRLGRKPGHRVLPAQVKALRESGLSWRTIGRQLGIAQSSARSLAKW